MTTEKSHQFTIELDANDAKSRWSYEDLMALIHLLVVKYCADTGSKMVTLMEEELAVMAESRPVIFARGDHALRTWSFWPRQPPSLIVSDDDDLGVDVKRWGEHKGKVGRVRG